MDFLDEANREIHRALELGDGEAAIRVAREALTELLRLGVTEHVDVLKQALENGNPGNAANALNMLNARFRGVKPADMDDALVEVVGYEPTQANLRRAKAFLN